MPTFILKYLKPILGVLVVLLLVFVGVFIRGLIADKADLRRDNEVLKESMEVLALQLEKERRATEVAQTVAREARTAAEAARRGLSNARRNDPAAAEWSSTPLPSGVRDALRSK